MVKAVVGNYAILFTQNMFFHFYANLKDLTEYGRLELSMYGKIVYCFRMQHYC